PSRWAQRGRPARALAQAAVLLIACGLTALATASLLSRADREALLARDSVGAHVRSLLQGSPTQVASSDTHAVKPWFSGRLEFSPPVRDLAAQGFALEGARLDYIGERRVAALVYRRRLHVINVFLWPAEGLGEDAPRSFVHNGYNVVAWGKAGLAYQAVSDLNADELRQLAALL